MNLQHISSISMFNILWRPATNLSFISTVSVGLFGTLWVWSGTSRAAQLVKVFGNLHFWNYNQCAQFASIVVWSLANLWFWVDIFQNLLRTMSILDKTQTSASTAPKAKGKKGGGKSNRSPSKSSSGSFEKVSNNGDEAKPTVVSTAKSDRPGTDARYPDFYILEQLYEEPCIWLQGRNW